MSFSYVQATFVLTFGVLERFEKFKVTTGKF